MFKSHTLYDVRSYISIIGLVGIMLLFSCQIEEEQITTDPNLSINYSVDTVKFDTLLVDRQSYTERLKVFNPHAKAIKFSTIRLRNPEVSAYNLIINGKEGKIFQDEILFGGDSLLVLIQATPMPSNLDSAFEIAESLLFSYNNNVDDIIVQSFGLDFNEIRSTIDCNAVWSGNTPYFISDAAVIDENCTLTIEKGVKVIMGNGKSITVNGSLMIKGDSSDFVTITNDFFDSGLRNTSGQWGQIYFGPSSSTNEISYTKISNGTHGLVIDTRDNRSGTEMALNNVEIKNMIGAGILTTNADVEMTNSVIYNCNQYLFGFFGGGKANLNYNTFSNEENSFFRTGPSLVFSGKPSSDTIDVLGKVEITLKNNIIWGSRNEELGIDETEGLVVSEVITNNIVKSASNVGSTQNAIGVTRNFPGFKSLLTQNYQLDSMSRAIDKGDGPNRIDFFGKERDNLPDIGAYEWFPKPDTTPMTN